ncbi:MULTISPECIES: type II toxin-antitoxin system RelE/ParE family toxin [Halomonas]|uniref:type II toxin-antitoxin system RelE/ParE family toxin n=1 Tax=Halomonas TaxID=2745 RepID=UPI001C96BF6D|nr:MULTISPECIES: type II toxin-antitoxin system RelE/ParE family toxin [Halomonas]MBY6230651.1 type II toxin-antitoxin system RelE/ParE family toxin [Halomonas sp. DP3Y7-1]MCA0918722.1 type II toxin-antitoxin system RelE/ParE family toxin [Halomonas denitrificans]
MSEEEKPIEFRGDSMDQLRSFPAEAMRTAGYELDRVQKGKMPDHYRPMPDIGRGVIEIKIREASGAYRVFYVASRGDAVYVLHCFQKKSQQTEKRDIELGKQRYRELF